MKLNSDSPSRGVLPQLPTLAWVALLMALWLLGLGSAPLIDVDEGAFSEASREMLASGDWGHTTLNGADRFDKPILIYWFQSASLALFGVNEWAARLPSAIAALMWCLAAVRFAQGWMGNQVSRSAAAVVATSLGVLMIGRAATADALLNALMCWACLDLWRHLDSGEKAPLRRAFFWMGLGLLTKGPVACLVPGASVVLYLLLSGQIGRLRTVLGDGWAWAIVLATAVPWYAYALHRHGMAFIDGFILQHNVNRFLHAKEGHGGAAYYTLVVAPLLMLPWTPLLVRVVARLGRLWREPMTRFLLCWSGFALLFFSLSNTKLPHYLLYGVTPLMILVAQALAETRSKAMGMALALSQLLLFGVLSWSQQVASWLAAQTRDPLYQTLLSSAAPGPAWWQLGGVGALWLAVWLWPRRPLAERAVMGALLGAFWTVMVVLPWWAKTLQSPVGELAAIAREQGGPVTQWHTRQPSFGFYLGAPTPPGEPPAGGLALIRRDRLPADADVAVVAERRGFLLVQRSAP
ncbi:MAG: glycosyltransferase family 39 protein [Burkholderiales bacterium]|nr:glycosyltransferase family 39 protein [Burkholderiales bacterium]